ncbi:MAG: phage tail tube protein [Afipia sp.]|nr:phage tail tube protein [Afipia sp.]
MADECCGSFGGIITIEIDGERWAPTEADVVLDVSNVEVSGTANQDGTGAFTSKPKLFGADITFRKPCGAKMNDKMRKCKINATIVEEDNNRTHLFTAARLVGAPKLNLSNGEISGLRIEGSRYQEV